MPKKLKKTSVLTVSLEPDLFDEFDNYAQDNFIDKSKLIEYLVKKHLKIKKNK
jgi:metal-responsive CopG/Arc/MetJ family transcriptional regulator